MSLSPTGTVALEALMVSLLHGKGRLGAGWAEPHADGIEKNLKPKSPGISKTFSHPCRHASSFLLSSVDA